MYSTTHNHVIFFTDPNGKNTEKMLSGKVSKAYRTGRKDADGNDVFAWEHHNARFVGKAREKAQSLTDKARITLTEWTVRAQPYTKTVNGEEKKRYFHYLMISDFEVREQPAETPESLPDPLDNAEDYAVLEDDDGQLPF